MISKRLRAALRALQSLTDDDHGLLDTWFAPGTRQHLYANGITDNVIGPSRENDYPESDEVHPPPIVRPFPKPLLLKAVLALRSLSDEEMKAIAQWFHFASRRALLDLGATQEEIGPWRADLDEVDTDDYRSPEAVEAEAHAQSLEGHKTGRNVYPR